MNPAIIDNMSWAMAEVYAAVTDRIMINLAHHFPYVQRDMHMGSFEYQSIMLAQMGKVEKETIAIIAGSLGNADEALKQALETAILEGLKNEEPKLRRAAMQGLLNGVVPQLAPSQMQAFTYFYNQSADKLNLVNTVMLESTKAAYQSTVADISQKIATTQSILNASAGEVITGVSTWNKAMHDGVQKMVKNGLTGFVDHGGHKWSPEAYVAMDVRTTMFNTARQAIWERQEQYGSDLYQVSSHNGARPLCYPWQGKVISTSGRTGITQDIDGNEVIIHSQDEIESFRYGGGLFGVNCGHYPMTFIPNFSSLKGEPQDPETNAKEYAESQQQRALERNLREQKRDLEVMKAQGASAEEIAKQRERVRSASADIDQFCDETGRARKRNREYAPVNAEFPEAKPSDVLVYKSGETNEGSYTPEIRKAVQDSVQTKDPAVIDLINRTSENCTIDWVEDEGTSHYSYGSGRITMYTKEYGDAIAPDDLAITRWHEYFHYIDDADVSNSGFVVPNQGYELHGIHWMASEDGRYQRAVADDINAFFRANGLDGKYECRFGDGQDVQWIFKNGVALNPQNMDYETTKELNDALEKWFNNQSGYTKAVNYIYEQGYPRQANWNDYFETYVTPKTQKVKTRPRYKGADLDYTKAVNAVEDAKEAYAATHDLEALFNEQRRLMQEADKARNVLGLVSDTFDGGAYGAFTSVIYGGHNPEYYAYNHNGLREGIANVGATLVTDNPIAKEGMKSLCPKTYQLLSDIITGRTN